LTFVLGAVRLGVLLKERLRLKDLPPPLLLASEYSTQTADTKRKAKKSAIIEIITWCFVGFRLDIFRILSP
jgi:hypothetical protein